MSHAFSRVVELMQPPLDGLPSGGNMYNQRLVEAAKARGIALSLRFVDARSFEARFREHSTCSRIWDSLFVEALAAQELEAAGDWGLLLHYLPSHNPLLDERERGRLATMEARVLRAAPLVIVTGDALLSRVRECRIGKPVFLCEPGVSACFLAMREKVASGTERSPRLLTVANLLPSKGLIDLLEILGRLRDIDWCWHVVGADSVDPAYARRFSDTVAELGLDARIRRHGALDQSAIALLTNSMDLFVFASRFEAYGMALAEAAAVGLPALTTNVGAAARIYRHGVTGCIVPPGAADDFTESLRTLMRDGEMRQRFRENLRACKPRTWQDTLEDFLSAIGAMA
jgi:glycosyltransferase involved in cell wall biosynthesis